MDIVLSVLDKVVALGAFVMMPVILFIMGMIFRRKQVMHYGQVLQSVLGSKEFL